METLDWVNDRLSSFRNDDYRWIRELSIEFEKYFDKEFREIVTNFNWDEDEIRFMILCSTDILFRSIGHFQQFDYLGEKKWFQESVKISSNPPSLNEETSLNKEKVEGLFIMLTLPWRIFIQNINKQLEELDQLRSDTEQIKERKRIIEIEKIKLDKAIEIYKEALGDRQEEQRKKIDNMAESYITACEKYITDKPTNKMLNEISTISLDSWKKQLTNYAFLVVLLEQIKKKKNLVNKNKKDKIKFWTNVYININKKLEKALVDSKVKKIEYSDNFNHNENKPALSKQKRQKASSKDEDD